MYRESENRLLELSTQMPDCLITGLAQQLFDIVVWFDTVKMKNLDPVEHVIFDLDPPIGFPVPKIGHLPNRFPIKVQVGTLVTWSRVIKLRSIDMF